MPHWALKTRSNERETVIEHRLSFIPGDEHALGHGHTGSSSEGQAGGVGIAAGIRSMINAAGGIGMNALAADAEAELLAQLLDLGLFERKLLFHDDIGRLLYPATLH
jgi:hypothetical protein